MSLFEMSDRAKKYQAELLEFMDSHVYPAEAVYHEQMSASGDPHFHPRSSRSSRRRRGDADCGTSSTRTRNGAPG
uniref:Acyl-CoA dehydrogenase/oxidase N-terminal domain-containing protein n=1 Tax=Streptomyces avermitilis TaxID=33903 RepID=A0A499V427_STRAX|nr:hypothetical protein SAVMC3_16630 [Streptomyces avermitilis]